jgi:DNA-binding MarR family transcriptional regulator
MSRGKPQQDLKEAMALVEELRPALQRLFRQLRREGPDLGISPLHALLLAAIREHPGIGVSELARLEKLRGPTISGHVKAMEALDLVERRSSHPEDRRRVGLVVSKKGTAIIEAMKRSKADWLAKRLAALSPEAREAIRNAIAPLNEIVQ